MSSDAPEINPDDLEPTIDLDLKLQKKILQLHAILKTADHYTLLGVTPLADKKEIRTAYFDLMNLYHTDKYYGKNLGNFTPKLQQIVQTLTKASDTLSRKKSRIEYDEYLASRQSTLGARTSVIPRAQSSHPPREADVSRSSIPPGALGGGAPQIPKAPLTPKISDSGPFSVERPVPSSDPLPNSAVASQRSGPVSQDAARRMLARKMGGRALGGGSVLGASGATKAAHPSPPPAASVRQAVEADLRQRYDARKNPGKLHLAKYLNMAAVAVQQGDWSQAVSSMKLAVQAAPDDPTVIARQAEVQQQADRALAPRFLEQARYEEKDGHPERAARSYERAAQGKNSAELFEKAARCLLKLGHLSDADKRKVVELARKSVTLDNRTADYRVTLARAYDVAGMRTSAQGEVRRALELEPNNKDAKELQKALR